MLFILLLRQGRPQRTAKINTRQLKYIDIFKNKKSPKRPANKYDSFSLLSRLGVCVKAHLHEPPLHYWRCVAAEGGRANAKKKRESEREERVCLALRGRILPQTNHHHRQLFNGILPHACQPCKGVKISFSISFTRVYSSRPCDAKLWAVTSPQHI